MSAQPSESVSWAPVEALLRRGRRLRKLGELHGVTDLRVGGHGVLVGRVEASRTHFDVASFCAQAAELVGAPVDLVSEAALVGRRVPEEMWSGERL